MISVPPADWRGRDVETLLTRLDALAQSRGRVLLGITGPPGAGKSTVAAAVASRWDAASVVVPMDGFHLANNELERLGRLSRKGAPDTFDAAGFTHLLRRIRQQLDDIVYAPVFLRAEEQAIAGAIPIAASDTLVIVEGNYLLVDGEFADVRELLDECWYVDPPPSLRWERLIERHVHHGRSREDAERWAEHTDAPNARLIESTRARADLVIDPAT